MRERERERESNACIYSEQVLLVCLYSQNEHALILSMPLQDESDGDAAAWC